jgi:uncharacterized membrane protein
MPVEAVAAALLSALIHAGWNAVLKSSRNRQIDVIVMGFGGVAFGIVMLLWRGLPDSAAWGYLAASSVVHVVYWIALERSYAHGDMSHVYTIARGLAPVLVTFGALLTAGETPSLYAGLGILLVSGGIAVVGFTRHASLRASLFAAVTGVAIAAYSLLDALGVRLSGDALAYIGASSLGTFLPRVAYAFSSVRPAQIAAAMPGRWLTVLTAGVMSNAGFGLALWAQTIAPIAYVTGLRETSVVFGAAIAAILLHERVSPTRWFGAVVVAVGAMLIAFGR